MTLFYFRDAQLAADHAFIAPDDLPPALHQLQAEQVDIAALPRVLETGGRGDALVMGHEGRFVREIAAQLRTFLARGGDLIWLGGAPFSQDWTRTSGQWELAGEADPAWFGLSPWAVEPEADLDPRQPRLAVRADLRAHFGATGELAVAAQLCRLMPFGAGRRVVLGTMTQGASTHTCPDLLALVEPGAVWNEQGGRVVCAGFRACQPLSPADFIAFVQGIVEVLRDDAPQRLRAAMHLDRLAAPQGEPIALTCASRLPAPAPLTTVIRSASGGAVQTYPLTGRTLTIDTAALTPGRYSIELCTGAEPLGLLDHFTVIEKPAPRRPRFAVTRKGPYAALEVNGRALPLHSYCGFGVPRVLEECVPSFAGAGVRLLHIAEPLAIGWHGPGQYDWSSHDALIERTLRAHPDALLMPRVRLTPPWWWVSSHRQSWWQHEGGLRDQPDDQSRPKFMSYYDQDWRRDTADAMAALIRHCKESWYRDRFVGVFYTYGSTGEWTEQSKDAILWLDHHPGFVERFREFLRTKYQTDAGLQHAWRHVGEVEPQDLRINDSHFFRTHNDRHHLLDDPQANLARARDIGPVTLDEVQLPNALRRRIGRYGIIRDPAQVRDVLDLLECYALSFAHLHADLCAGFKRDGSDILLGTFVGYSLGGPYEVDGGYISAAYPEFLDINRDMDFLTTASFYWGSENPTGDQVCKSLHESYHLHGKVYLQETDQRTCLVKIKNHGQGTPHGDVFESANSMKRNWLLRVSRGAGLWWFDLYPAMYEHPLLMDTVRLLQKIQQRLLDEPNPRSFDQELTRAALFYSVKSHLHTVAASNYLRRVGDNFAQRHWNRIGIPWEIYFPEDVERMPERRVYLFLNTFYLTQAQRRTIAGRFKRNGNMLIWLYAPGIVDEQGYDLDHVSQLTGFRLEADQAWRQQRIAITNQSHPIAREIGPTALPDFGSVMSDDWGTSAELDRISPQIYVSSADRDAVPIGLQEGTDRVAFAVKDCGDWTSVYASAAIMPAAVIRALLRWRGIPLHTDGLDAFYTNGDLVGINALSSGYKTLRFPGEFVIEDLCTGQMHKSQDGTVRLWLAYRETFIGRIYKTCPTST